MVKVMEGVRVLEVAQFTFVPAAGAILADWGADVIKIEHPVRGDTQRGFINMGGIQVDPDRHPLMEHPNRGKRSVGVDVSTPDGQEVIYEIAKTSDVFLTNYLPAQRQKTQVRRRAHPRGEPEHHLCPRQRATATRGPSATIGGFDGTAFWTRSGVGYAMTPGGTGRRAGAGHSGVRRFHRRHEHRRRHLGRPVPSRAHRRSRRARRLAAEHRLVGGGRERRLRAWRPARCMRTLHAGLAARRRSIPSWATSGPPTAARSTCASSARPASSATPSSTSASPRPPTIRGSPRCCR